MSLIMRVHATPDFAARESVAAPERLVAGSPSFKTWAFDESLAGIAKVRTGVWEATPGTSKSIKGTTFEFCHMLSGHVEITEDGGETHRFRAGDSFLMKPGFTGEWKTIETVRKMFVIVG